MLLRSKIGLLDSVVGSFAKCIAVRWMIGGAIGGMFGNHVSGTLGWNSGSSSGRTPAIHGVDVGSSVDVDLIPVTTGGVLTSGGTI